jgi:hypothetical protein
MQLLRAAIAFIRRLATQPQVAELFRFIFLGTIVETGRQMAAKIADFATDRELFVFPQAQYLMVTCSTARMQSLWHVKPNLQVLRF